MLLDGESGGPYHNWRMTTRVLKKELDETGLFAVDVVTAPAAGANFSAFKPDFSNYQAIVMNYDAPDDRWPADLKAAFERYVTNGGGLVIVHAADNAFPGWKAYNDMIGVGGWRDRTEKAGPFWFFKDGTLTSDTTPGKAGQPRTAPAVQGHRSRCESSDHERAARACGCIRATSCTRRCAGPGRNMTVLATAYSDPSNNGTGRDEPQLMVLSYGRGRVFHTTMGHDVSALSSVDFVATFQRGVEWAATGAVTQQVPAGVSDRRCGERPRRISRRWIKARRRPGGRGAQASPASVPPPASATPQSYPPEQVRAGQPLFSAQCGFCHGRDAMGGETGPDLTRARERRRRRARRHDRPARAQRPRRQGHAGVQPRRRRPRRDRRVHPRPEDRRRSR